MHAAAQKEQVIQFKINEAKILYKILNNILEHPNNPKYKNLNAQRVYKRLQKCKKCIRSFYDAGFYKSHDGKRLLYDNTKLNQLKLIKQKLSSFITSTENASTKNDGNTVNLIDQIEHIAVLNVDEDESTLSAQEISIDTISNPLSYILSDADEELLILIEFQQIINLHEIILYALSKTNEHINSENHNVSPPKQIHIYKLDNLNKDFNDIAYITPDISIKCLINKLQKGQLIKLQNNAKNAIKFKKIKYLGIYVESNQHDTELTYLNQIEFKGNHEINNRKMKIQNKKTNVVNTIDLTQISKKSQFPQNNEEIIFNETDIQNRNKIGEISKRYKQNRTDRNRDQIKSFDLLDPTKIFYTSDAERLKIHRHNRIWVGRKRDLMAIGIAFPDEFIKIASKKSEEATELKNKTYLKSDTESHKPRFDENVVNNLVALGIASRDDCIRASSMTNNYKDANAVFATLEKILNDQLTNTLSQSSSSRKYFIQNKECHLSNCISLANLTDALSKYHSIIACHVQPMQTEEKRRYSIDDIHNDNNNITSIIDDFHHLLTMHSHQFEEIHDVLSRKCYNGKTCTLSNCLMMKRNHRDRSTLRTNDAELKRLYFNDQNDDNAASVQQILDKIHCHYFHSFDTGYKISKCDMIKIQQMMDNNVAREDIDETVDDAIAQSIYAFISKHFKTNTNKSMKFTTSGDSELLYSFGIRFFYWEYYKYNVQTHDSVLSVESKDEKQANENYLLADFYINPKYKDLKDELLNNSIYTLSEVQWSNLVQKAQRHLKSQYFASMIYSERYWMSRENIMKEATKRSSETLSSSTYSIKEDLYTDAQKQYASDFDAAEHQYQHYNIKQGTPITLIHLIAMMTYCNYDVLQRKFSETCRRISQDETNDSVVCRHSNYAHLGRLLRECVELFGTTAALNGTALYHGITGIYQFESMYTRINGPLSTTTDYSVAVNFSGNDGMIIELSLKGGWHEKGSFECQYLSDFSNEQEIFFIGGYGHLAFQSIIIVPSGENYKLYLAALETIFEALQHDPPTFDPNSKLDPIVQQIGFRIILHELHRHYPNDTDYHEYKSMPTYIQSLVQNHFASINTFDFGSTAMFHFRKDPTNPHKMINDRSHLEAVYYHNIFPSLFFYDYGWIKIQLITKLFPSLKYIKLNDITENDKFIHNPSVYLSVLSLLKTNPKIKLQKIIIMISAHLKPKTEQFISSYQTRFAQLNWSLVCKNGFYSMKTTFGSAVIEMSSYFSDDKMTLIRKYYQKTNEIPHYIQEMDNQ